MQYKVVPFIPSITRDENTVKLSAQLEQIIISNVAGGWQYVRVEPIATWVPGTNGCFGMGAQPGYNTVFHVVVFNKPE